MNHRLVSAACLAILASVGLGARLEAKDPWHELRGGGFVLRGPLSREALGELGCDLQAVLHALPPSSAGADSNAVVLDVLAVKSGRDAKQLMPALFERRGARPFGAYWSGPQGHHIVVRVDAAPAERRRRILHEYAHFRAHLSHSAPPRWLDEGLAEVWEHASIRPDRIAVGQPVSAHMKTLRSRRWIPIADAVGAASLPSDDKTLALFYAQSWALVRYLMMKGETRDLFAEPPPAHAALPTEAELRHFLATEDGGLTIPRSAPSAGCAELPVRALSSMDLLMVKARALADGDRPAAARPLLSEVLRLESGHPGALETLGIVRFAGNEPRQAADAFDRVIAGGHGTHLAYYYRALLAGPVPELSDGSGRVPVVEYLRRALALEPGFGPALDRLQELLGKDDLVCPVGL